jgi:hypothetical protein
MQEAEEQEGEAEMHQQGEAFMTSRRLAASKAILAAGALALSMLAFAAKAEAVIYAACQNGCNAIQKAELDGTIVSQNFINTTDVPTGLASDGPNLYWGNYDSGTPAASTIARAELDDAGEVIGVNHALISGANRPLGVAVVPAGTQTFLFWVNGGTSTIGRAVLDSSGEVVGTPDPEFVDGQADAFGLAYKAPHLFWTIWPDEGDGSIARAEISSSGELVGTPNQAFLTGLDGPFGVGADTTHLYWTNNTSGTIGRAELSAAGEIVGEADPDFIAGQAPPGEDAPISPGGVASDGTNVYWANRGLPLFDSRADDVGRAPISDPVGGFDLSIFDSNGVVWGLVVQRGTDASVDCPTAPESVTCTATVTDSEGTAGVSPVGRVLFEGSGGGTFTPAAECTLAPSGAGSSTCSVAYARPTAEGESIDVTYTGSSAHSPSSGEGILLPVPVEPGGPGNPNPTLPVPAAPKTPNALKQALKKCKKKKGAARKKCVKKAKRKFG